MLFPFQKHHSELVGTNGKHDLGEQVKAGLSVRWLSKRAIQEMKGPLKGDDLRGR